MAEEKPLARKQIKTLLVGDSELPSFHVNVVNVRAGNEEFFVTLATAVPPEITDIKDLEKIDTVEAQSLFRFVLTRNVMKQVIDLMKNVYDQQTEQLNLIGLLQEKE